MIDSWGLVFLILIIILVVVIAAVLIVQTGSSKLKITFGPKACGNPFTGLGSSDGFIINGASGKVLNLTRNMNYTFENTTSVPFYFTKNPGGGPGNAFQVHGTPDPWTNSKRTVNFPPETPEVIYYGSTNNNEFQGGTIVLF